MEILIGLGAGIIAAVACALFYSKGLKDGMRLKKTVTAVRDDGGEDAGSELMRKYELIMGYYLTTGESATFF